MVKNLFDIYTPNLIKAIQQQGMHKVAAKLAQAEGFDVPEDEISTLTAATRLLGTRLFLKESQFSRIAAGLDALEEL